MKLSQRITGALLVGALALSAFAGPASANSFRISNNGSDSDNSIQFRSERDIDINQSNDADFDNNIRVRLSTGDNDASDNTRGDVRIRTGDADASVRVSNLANFNYASVNHDDSDHDWNSDYDWIDRHDGKDSNFDHEKDYDYNLSKYDDTDHDYDKDHDDSDKHDGYDGKYHEDDEDNTNYKSEHDDSDHPHNFHASLSGEKEVPGPGDEDGHGHFKSHANHEENKLCVEMHVSNIDPATAAHIHYGEKGVAGPVVITLPTPNADGHASGCMDVNHDTLWEITQSLHDYYVNVHNAEYPDGAVRGQLYAE